MTQPFYCRLTIILILSLGLLGCLRTELTSPSISNSHFKLAALAPKTIKLLVNSAVADNQTLGNQYLLLLIPFGQIHLDSPRQNVLRRAYEELSIRGYKPIIVSSLEQDSSSQTMAPTLELNLNSLSLTAFDLLFLRRISSKLTLQGRLLSSRAEGLDRAESERSESAFARLAFRVDLEPILNKNIEISVKEILDRLKL